MTTKRDGGGGGHKKVHPVLRGGGGGGGGAAQKVLDPIFSRFVDPFPITNDQSLRARPLLHILTSFTMEPSVVGFTDTGVVGAPKFVGTVSITTRYTQTGRGNGWKNKS